MKNYKEVISFLKKYSKNTFTKKRIGIFLIFFITSSSLYHNEKSYDYFEEKINPRLTSILQDDPLLWLNVRLHLVDVVGRIKCINNPLKESDLIDIQIKDDQKKRLSDLLKENPVKKKWVKVEIKIKDNFQKAKLKFHGTQEAHYAGNKYSYSFKLSNNSKFIDNFRKFKLIKGEQADPTIIAINQVAKSMGLISAAGKMKMLRINGVNQGDYYFVEDIKKEFLEREFGITNYTTISSTTDWTRKEPEHVTENDFYFGHVEKEDNPLHPQALNQFKILSEYIEKNDLENIKKMFDIDYMGKYLALASLFNDIHFMSGDNLKFIYDFSRGKFYPIYRAETMGQPIHPDFPNAFSEYNKLLFQSYGQKYLNCKTSELFKLLLSDNSIREIRDKYLYKFIQNKGNFIAQLKNTHEENERIMLHSGRSRRIYDRQKNKQIALVSSLLDLSKNYLNYTHIYGCYDKEKQELHIFQDAFVPFTISYKNSKFKVNNNFGIEFDNQLNPISKHQVFHMEEEKFNPDNLIFVNEITKKMVTQHIHINYINTSDTPDTRSTIQMLKDNNIHYQLTGNKLSIKPDTYTIRSNVVISSNYITSIPTGVIFLLDKDINFSVNGNITISGTKENNVIIKNLHAESPFGCFSILGNDSLSFSRIDYLKVSGGRESTFMGRVFTGQFAIYNSNVRLTNSTFENGKGDDGLNIKFSKIQMDNCHFVHNSADQLDIDFCVAKISDCSFSSTKKNQNCDGLDLSGSYAQIINCKFSQLMDKGLSLGEKSIALVHSCEFRNNAAAIAVKDQTKLFSWGNKFESNQYDYSSFVKKRIFNEPKIYLNGTIKNLKLNINKQKNLYALSRKEIEINENKFKNMFGKYTANGFLSNRPQID